MTVKTPTELRTERFRVPPPPGDLWIAALWPHRWANLGTLARTADALNARLVVPHDNPHVRKAVSRGDTIGLHNVHLVRVMSDPIGWLAGFKGTVVGVELAHGAMPLRELLPADGPTCIVLGHESHGIPLEAWEHIDYSVEIPMHGVGNSLNVAVAGSLVAYRLAGAA